MEREPIVTLTETEMWTAVLHGGTRAAAAIAEGRQNRARGIDDDGRIWTRHVEGACAEIAVAKALDRYYGGAGGARARDTKAEGGDVGRLQVRCRIADHLDQRKRLIIQERDPAGDDFVLAVGRLGVYRVVGWINAGHARRHPEWIQNPGNFGEAWFVPQDALAELRFLPEVAGRRAA